MSDASSDSPTPLAPRPPGPSSGDETAGAPDTPASPALAGHVNAARLLFLLLGALTILCNAVFFFRARDNVRQVIEAGFARAEGDPQQIEEDAVLDVTLVYSAHIALGVLFLILGVLVKQFPVAVAVLGLVLYVASTLAFALIEPTILLTEAIKLAFVIPLVWVIQSLADWRAGRHAA